MPTSIRNLTRITFGVLAVWGTLLARPAEAADAPASPSKSAPEASARQVAPETAEAPSAAPGQTTAAAPAPAASGRSHGGWPVLNSVYILVLAGFVGFEVIGRVSPLLHTPLMSATNAISGISLVGSLVAAGSGELGTLCHVLGFIAVTAATINVVGGFLITDRMLRMFKLRGKEHHG